MLPLDHAYQKSITNLWTCRRSWCCYADVLSFRIQWQLFSDIRKINCYKDELDDAANEYNPAGNYRINSGKTTASKFFEYKAKIIGNAPAHNNNLDTEVVVPLKYLSNFWWCLDLPLINCKIEPDLSWSRNCINSEISRTAPVTANPYANPPAQVRAATRTTGVIFQIISSKLYTPVVTLSINDSIIFLEKIKQGFNRTISWDKYRSKITTKPKK